MQRQRVRWAVAAVACALLAVVHTWPLATAPGVLSRNDNGDAQLNEWIMAWVAHQLPRDPAHLFQGNIFYPARDTLAYSEPLIVPALLGAPVAWLGGSPVLVFNLMVIAGFALTALAGYAMMLAWTGDRAAALLTGSMFAFNTHTLTRLAHVQGLHIYGLPLALLAADRVITGTGRRAWLWLAVWMTVMAYTSGYLVVFAVIMIAVALAARVPEWWGRVTAVVSSFALAAAAATAAILPLYIPYRRVARSEHMVRPLEAVLEYSATLKGYLAAAGTIHFSTWSGAFFKDPVDSFFPGVIVITLAIVAVARISRDRRDPDPAAARGRMRMLIAIAAAGLLLSLGTRTPVYGWLYAVFPPMQGLRAAARFGNLFLLGMSALAGLGLAHLRRGRARTLALAVATAAVLAAANLESLRAPFEYRRFTGIPALYTVLANEPGPVVLAEMPFYPRQAVFENAEYVLNSTAHWRPLMNGYSGYTPDSYVQVADDLWHFPEDRAIAALRRAGVTHVMVHPAKFLRDAELIVEQTRARPELELLGVGNSGLRLYRLH
jgi:hypothetical protein